MIKIENIDVYGFEAAIRGMRNPYNSWDKSDSYWGLMEDESPINPCDEPFYFIGENDLALMKKLAKAGTDHSKYLRMITVTMDITAPLYFFKEYDTYKIGTTANSTSTMHTIHKRALTLDDFSLEHLGYMSIPIINELIDVINLWRTAVVNYDDMPEELKKRYTKKECWYNIIQLLPSSYNQRRTVQLNYEVLRNMYFARKNHKLDEWRQFCETIETLPYFKEIFIDK